MQACSKCTHEKPLSAFYKDKQNANGHSRRCKECANAVVRAWVSANPDKRKTHKQTWFNNNPQYFADHYKLNMMAKRAANDNWARLNIEAVRKYKAQWNRDNPEAVKASRQNRRARIKSAEGTHTGADIHQLQVVQKMKCACCRVSLKDSGYHIDHIQPLASGGGNDRANLQLLCPPCNLSKGARDPVAFMQSKGFLC